MFDLRVTGYDGAMRLIESNWPTRIVSVFTRTMPAYGTHHIQVLMDDIARPSNGMVLPAVAHLHQILDFTVDLDTDDRVLVHCSLGINRSTAAAIAILLQHNIAYDDAYRQIAKQRPRLAPNRLLTTYIDQHFKLGGKLNKLVVRS